MDSPEFQPGDMYRMGLEKELNDENKIGKAGGEKTVYELQNDPKKVVGFFHESVKETPNIIKARYYLTKIIHLLFPNNVPDMHMAASNPHAIISDKVMRSNNPDLPRPTYSQMTEIADRFEQAGVYGLDLAGAENFIRDTSNNIFYVDSFTPWVIDYDDTQLIHPVERFYSPEGLEKSIQTLPPDLADEAKEALERLNFLYEEDMKAIRNGTLFN